MAESRSNRDGATVCTLNEEECSIPFIWYMIRSMEHESRPYLYLLFGGRCGSHSKFGCDESEPRVISVNLNMFVLVVSILLLYVAVVK